MIDINPIMSQDVHNALDFLYDYERGGIYEDSLNTVVNALHYAETIIHSYEAMNDSYGRTMDAVANNFYKLQKENKELHKLLSKNIFKEFTYKIQRWCRG